MRSTAARCLFMLSIGCMFTLKNNQKYMCRIKNSCNRRGSQLLMHELVFVRLFQIVDVKCCHFGDVVTQHRRVVLLSTFYTATCDSHFMTLCWFAPFPYACIQLRNARTTYITISYYDNLQARYFLLQSSPYSKMSMHVD